jgi:ABC-2 type transport system permease protein
VSRLTGTGQLLRLAIRRDRVVATVWVLGLFVFAFSQAASIVSLYPTQADLDRLARTATGIGANPAVVALQGPAYDASTYGGATAWQVVTPGVFLIGLMSLLLMTRHTRQEEETGRAELVSAGAVGRNAWLAASLLFVLGVNVVLAALSVLGYVAMGLPVGGSVALAVACGLNGLVFAGVAAVTAQLTEYARPANGMAFAGLGAAFLLRAVGDTSSSLSWLAWLSPIGWAERFRPFAGERWAVLLLPVALLLVLLVATVALRDRRDLGAGVLATRLGPATAPAWLRSPLALAWRLQRGALLGWAIGAAVAGLSFGVLAKDMAQFAAEDPETAKMLATLGGPAASPTSTWPPSCPGSACWPPATPCRPSCGCAPRRPSCGPSRCWPPPPPGSAGPAATCWWPPWGRRSCSRPAGWWPAWPTGCAPAT